MDLQDLDSVPLDALQAKNNKSNFSGNAQNGRGKSQSLRGQPRDLVMIFILFLVVISDFFANNVLARFSEKTLEGRAPSAWGVILQGICLAVGYALLVHLDENQIL